MANKVVHFEVPYDDKDRVQEFYSNVFGWKMQDMPEMNYLITHTVDVDDEMMPVEKGAINGGFYQRDDGNAAKSPVLVIDVENIEDHLKKIEEAGGSVVVPMVQVGEMGLYAQVNDTEGNIIGIWQNIKK